MKTRVIVTKSVITILLIAMMGCDKDGLKNHMAEALTSFEGKWEAGNATFSHSKSGLVTISFDRYIDNIEIEVIFRNIELTEGTTNLLFYSVPILNEPTSIVHIILEGDQAGESYYVDTASVLQSSITITSITKHRVEGEFQVAYMIKGSPLDKVAPWIPDQFTLTEGRFNAKD